jgi:hypothetical protein
MDSVLWSVGSVFVTGLGAVAFVHGFRSLRLQRLIRDTPTAKVRSLAMGMVELQGTVTSRSRTRAPFSGHDCVWWEVELQTMSKSNKGTRHWHTVHRERSGHPFYVDDGTGTALVFPQGADVRAGDVVSEETHGFGVPEPYAGYMQSRELGMRHLWSMGPMRFRERRLEEGRTVYVLGRAEPRPQAIEVSMDDEDVLEATGTDAIGARHVREHDGRCAAVIRKGRRDPALLISDRSEKTMSVEYGLKAFGGLVGGPLLSMFGLWCLVELARSGELPFIR